MDESLLQLWELASRAVEIANSRFGLTLSPNDWQSLDDLLHQVGQQTRGDGVEELASTFGAWLGAWAVSQLDGQWIGLHEPVAPRVDVHGLVFSPIDAVRRRVFAEPHSLTIAEIASRLIDWKCQHDSKQTIATYQSTNRHAWDQLADDPRFSATDEDLVQSYQADSPVDPWLDGFVAGRDVLCLAAGGGLHGPRLAACGARVTVVDLSPRLLAKDHRIAAQHDLPLRTVECSMDNLHGLDDSSFDVVVQPVSSCYVPDLMPMFTEVARVLRVGGLYLSQHKQPTSLQAGTDFPYAVKYSATEGMPLSDEAATEKSVLRESGTTEFLHSLTSILGGMCRSGFVIANVEEPVRADAFATPGTYAHRASYLPPYIKVKARRVDSMERLGTHP